MESPHTTSSPVKSFSPLLIAGLITTILVVIAGVFLAVFTSAMQSIANSSGTQSIEKAAEPQFTLTIIVGVYAILAGLWTLWFARGRGVRSLATMVCATLSVVLLLAASTIGWQVLTQSRSLTIAPMICEASGLKVSGGNPTDGCQDSVIETGVTLTGERTDDTWSATTDTQQVSSFADLPTGDWTARLTVDGQDDTVAVHVIAQRDDRWVRIGQLRPSLDIDSGELHWSGVMSTRDRDRNLRVQYFASENPAVASASIRFDVRDCTNQSIRTFDASACQPLETAAVLVQEQSPEGARTWRQPRVTIEGTTLVVVNLEARTYELAPNYAAVQTATGGTDILIIPTAMEQIEANSASVPGDSSFPVEITPATGVIEYTIYVFSSGGQVAFAP